MQGVHDTDPVMWCQGSSLLSNPDSVNTSLLISFLFQVSVRELSGSHASACMKFTGRTGANCRTQPCSQRFCSLDLGQVPGICLFKKHCRNFCCRHPRTTPETLWPALVFSLGPNMALLCSGHSVRFHVSGTIQVHAHLRIFALAITYCQEYPFI